MAKGNGRGSWLGKHEAETPEMLEIESTVLSIIRLKQTIISRLQLHASRGIYFFLAFPTVVEQWG